MKAVLIGHVIKESLSGSFCIMISDDDNLDARHGLRMAMLNNEQIKVTVEDVE